MSEELTLLPCPACGGNTELRCHNERWRTKCRGFAGCTYRVFEGQRFADRAECIGWWNSLPRALVWTTVPPKVVGWYFWRSDTFQGNGYESTIYIADVSDFLEKIKTCAHKNVMFAGPIPMPKEPTS